MLWQIIWKKNQKLKKSRKKNFVVEAIKLKKLIYRKMKVGNVISVWTRIRISDFIKKDSLSKESFIAEGIKKAQSMSWKKLRKMLKDVD